MTPNEFIAKWRASELKERSAAQEHFIDLCRLLGESTPAEADPTGERYCFERGARKDTGGDGWADVWKRHCFAWEYKGRHADLDAAFNQLRQYALALENPPLLIVSDMARFRIRTNWTNSVSLTHEFGLDDLADAATRDKLKWAMSDPERLRPGESRQALTERAAATFAVLAQSLRERGHEPQAVAHFVNRLVFCMFAEDVGLLPADMFTRMLQQARKQPEEFAAMARALFGAMATGGLVGFESVAWFNGGLFDDDAALPLERSEIETTLEAAALDWSEIDPSILGTLFERGLDPDKRSQLGAHYTDRDKIMRIVEPVVIRPWLTTWEVDAVHADLTARRGDAGVDLTGAQRLYRNMGVAFMGDTKGGPFDVPGEQAREWLREPANPNGRPNSDVLGPWMNGMDVTRRPSDKWIVDFGWNMVREEAALYEAPFQHAKEHVYPMRQRNRRESYREHWWRHVEPRQGMWRALDGLSRYIATPTVAKHRLFTWLDARVCPDHQLIVIARDDDVTFGILHSRFHEAWSLRLGTSLEDRPRYTPTTTFETFPFPEGLSPDVPASDYADDPQAIAIAEVARRLVSLRDRWLNPPELVEWVDEPVSGYPKRAVPHNEEAEKTLKKRTLTNLYNARPQWLDDAHAALDTAVAVAYGWPAGISDEDALRELLALNGPSC